MAIIVRPASLHLSAGACDVGAAKKAADELAEAPMLTRAAAALTASSIESNQPDVAECVKASTVISFAVCIRMRVVLQLSVPARHVL